MSMKGFLDLQNNTVVETPPKLESEMQERLRLQIDDQFGPYRVRPLDVLEISIVDSTGSPLFPLLKTRVRDDGIVRVPIAGEVSIGGLTLDAVEKELEKRYMPDVVTQATVHVDMIQPEVTSVLVVGAVSIPGLVPLRGQQRNMLFAIVGAGGVSQAASGKATLKRLREPGDNLTYDLTDPLQLSAALTLPSLENGDIVEVEAADPNLVYVGGLVNRPAAQSLPPGTRRNVLQALADAGGLRTDVTPTEGTLIRRFSDQQDLFVKLPIRDIQTGKAPNIELAAGDILWVPETIGTEIEEFINKTVFFRAGASVVYTATGVEYLNRASQQNGSSGQSTQDLFDPFGYLTRNAALQGLSRN